jgi:uncharacterized protein (DUF952 family)
MVSTIFHIAARADWAAAQAAGAYTADSLASEGFIHCSTAAQVIATANRIFKGRHDLVLLSIDSARVKPEIRYENLEGGTQLFPHIYGALAIDAVIAVHDFPPSADGSFVMPF